MSQRKIIQTSNQTLRYLIASVGFMLWLMSSGISIVHAQEHTLLDEHHCQLCFIVENSSSEAASHHVALVSFDSLTLIITSIKVTTAFITPIFLSNRYPPVILRS